MKPLNHKYAFYSSKHYRGYGLYWLLIAFVFITFAALPFIYVDVTVQSRGVITSQHKTTTITSPQTAKVIKVNLKENLKVEKGDTLLVLHQEGLKKEQFLNEQQITQQRVFLSDLNLIINKEGIGTLQSELYKKQWSDFLSAEKKYERKINKLKVDFDRTSELYSDGVVALSDFQQDSFKLKEVEDELLLLKTSTNARWENEAKVIVESVHQLKVQNEQLKQQQSQYLITAPYNGSIIAFNGVAVGGFVNENEVLAQLSPYSGLVAECYVSPSDIGFIRKGMPVRFQVDTYDYNQWGLLDGQVLEVANDVTLNKGEYVYLIRCQLSNDYLQLGSGTKGALKKGMSITGRFFITQRSLFQLLFDKVDDWFNPKIINE